LDRSSKEIVISKEILPELPPSYEKTLLGDKRRASKQYRSSSNVHVREYDDKYVVHIDVADPRSNPIGHLVKDSPETIAAFATSMCIVKDSIKKSESMKGRNDFLFSGLGLLTFLTSFFVLNDFFKVLKRILF
jgi:hypothetical protein